MAKQVTVLVEQFAGLRCTKKLFEDTRVMLENRMSHHSTTLLQMTPAQHKADTEHKAQIAALQDAISTINNEIAFIERDMDEKITKLCK